jgi:hypothetical protein
VTSIVYRTIADFLASGHTLAAYCGDATLCHHGAVLDLEALAGALGARFRLLRLRSKDPLPVQPVWTPRSDVHGVAAVTSRKCGQRRHLPTVTVG